MLISDPKGELYQLHAKKLKKTGYKVQILDLRNPYNSVRWNPLERAYLNYQRMLHLEKEVKVGKRITSIIQLIRTITQRKRRNSSREELKS